jgi:hypothetical protein
VRDTLRSDFGRVDREGDEIDALLRTEILIECFDGRLLALGVLGFLEVDDGPNPELCELGEGAGPWPATAIKVGVNSVKVADVFVGDPGRVRIAREIEAARPLGKAG